MIEEPNLDSLLIHEKDSRRSFEPENLRTSMCR